MSTPDERADEPADAANVRVEVHRGAPTDQELAALIAVVTEAYSTEAATAVADEPSGRDAWTLSQRSLRAPLDRAAGWRGSAG